MNINIKVYEIHVKNLIYFNMTLEALYSLMSDFRQKTKSVIYFRYNSFQQSVLICFPYLRNSLKPQKLYKLWH